MAEGRRFSLKTGACRKCVFFFIQKNGAIKRSGGVFWQRYAKLIFYIAWNSEILLNK